MIVLNKSQQRRPFGGHHFPEGGRVIRAEKFEDVVRKVGEFRIINNHPIGNPEAEVLRYYAEHFPFMVENDEYAQEPKPPSKTYLRWAGWIRAIWNHPPKRLVTHKEATLRWELCKTCPKNEKKAWTKSDETEDLERRAFLLRCGADIPDYLGFCGCHRADLGVFSFMAEPSNFNNKDKDEIQPERCWV